MRHDRRSWVSFASGVLLVVLASFRVDALGATETAVREVRGVDSVSLGTSGELVITQGDREELQIVASAGDLPMIVTEVRDGTLSIGWEQNEPAFSVRPPAFRLAVKTMAGLETHSSGRITARDMHASSLRIRVSSSGSVSIDTLSAGSLDIQIVSSGSVRVGGRVDRQEILLSSSGNYLARNLASTTARVHASSSGSATLRVSDSLEANVTSSGDVRYYGNPRVDGRVTSSGRLVKLGE